MLAIKIIVIKITKKGISSSRIKVMHSLQSKKYASQWFNNYKTLHIITPHNYFGWNYKFRSSIISLPDSIVVCHIL